VGVDISWNGPGPADITLCPHAVYFLCKPAPAESLSSLESGRLLLQVDLSKGGGRGDEGDEHKDVVASVLVQLINNSKAEKLEKLDDEASRIKRQTSISTSFVKDINQPKRWHGELSIPASWVEGSTTIHEKTRAAAVSSRNVNLYTLKITYTLATTGNRCTASFGSEDAFHWNAGPNAPV